MIESVAVLVIAAIFTIALHPVSVEWMLNKQAQRNVFYQLQHPATEELREIYRAIDRDIMITDPDLLTPEAKLSPPKSKLMEHLNNGARYVPLPVERIETVWVNLLYSPDEKTPFEETNHPRQPVRARYVREDNYDIIDAVDFLKWKGPAGRITVGVFNTDDRAEKRWFAKGPFTKVIMPGDIITLSAVEYKGKKAAYLMVADSPQQ